MDNPSTADIAVVIPNWNGEDRIIQCLDALSKQSLACSVIVVDNGSTDTSVDLILSHYPQVTVLKQPYNLGFAGGVNVGIKHAIDNGASYIALLNNDAVVDPDWLGSLRNELSTDASVGICTSLILSLDGAKIDSTGEFYTSWGLPFPRNRDDNSSEAPTRGLIFGASGGASIYRTQLFNDIGYFDDKYFAYYEDTDISFRAQLAGWHIAYTPKAIAYHATSSTSRTIPGFTVKQTFRNLPMLYIKNVPGKLLFSVGIRFYFAYLLILGKALMQSNRISALKGFFEGFGLLPHSLHERKSIQSTKKVSTEEIKQLLWHDLPPHQKGLRKLRGVFVRTPTQDD